MHLHTLTTAGLWTLLLLAPTCITASASPPRGKRSSTMQGTVNVDIVEVLTSSGEFSVEKTDSEDEASSEGPMPGMHDYVCFRDTPKLQKTNSKGKIQRNDVHPLKRQLSRRPSMGAGDMLDIVRDERKVVSAPIEEVKHSPGLFPAMASSSSSAPGTPKLARKPSKVKVASVAKYQPGATLKDGGGTDVKIMKQKKWYFKKSKEFVFKVADVEYDRVSMEDIQKEIEILRQLKHPNIIAVRKIIQGVRDGREVFGIATDKIEGENLCDYVRKNHPLDEDEIKWLAMGAVKGLLYMHERNFAHRDVKCDNFMVTNDKKIAGRKKLIIIDLGTGFKGDPDDITTKCGTPEFAAPEVYEKVYTPFALDVYSLGVTLLFMRTSVMLERGSEWQAELSNILNAPMSAPDVNKYPRVVFSPDFLDLVSKMILPPPEERWPMGKVIQHAFFDAVRDIGGAGAIKSKKKAVKAM